MTPPDYPGLLADLAAEEDALDTVVADLDPAAWATPTPAVGWDVRDALGLDPEVSARLRHVADLGVRTRPFAYETRGHAPNRAPVRVELTGPDGARWTWGGPADDVVRGPALDFCLVVTQRIHPADAGLVVTGTAAEEWIGIAQAFAGAPTDHRPRRAG